MVQPKKHLGQHFLRDENIAKKIVGFVSPQTPFLLEIGPGTGVLSKYLLKADVENYLAVDIDRESIEFLKNNFPEDADKFVYADFLKLDFGAIYPGKITVIGNFPYNISTQILFRIIEHRNKVTEVIGMFQKEVAERICSDPGTKKYGIPSVLIQAYFDVDYLFTVNETVFFPPPKVKSAVIRISRNQTEKLNCDEALFFQLVKAGFNQRRKTLRNSLKSFGIVENEIIKILLDKRAEQLTVSDFEMLAQQANQNK
jgi:16S rRNA (adenine1518-N6/adenine1519-N6)-dimethyltransferase